MFHFLFSGFQNVDPDEVNTFDSDVTFNVTSNGVLISDNTVEVKLGSNIEINFISMSDVDNFYIDGCTAMDNSVNETTTTSLSLVESGCQTVETDPVLAQIDSKVGESGRQLSFNQFAFSKTVSG